MARRYLKSGFYAPALIPPDSPVAELLRERREGLIADLGGREACSMAKLALVDLIVTAWWQLESVSAYLMTLSSLVDRRHRRVWQVVRDRGAMAAQLQSLVRDVGLERRAMSEDIVAMAAEHSPEEPVRRKSKNGR